MKQAILMSQPEFLILQTHERKNKKKKRKKKEKEKSGRFDPYFGYFVIQQ